MEHKRSTLILEPVSKRLHVENGSTVYEGLLALNYPIGALCAGKGTCGKCLIRIMDPKPKISEPNEKELKVLGKEKIADGYRLACQAQVLGDLRVYLTEALIPKGSQILIDSDLNALGIEIVHKMQPLVSAREYVIKTTDLKTQRNDLTGLNDAILSDQSNHKLYDDNSSLQVNDCLYNISKKLPFLMREKEGAITAFFRRNTGKNEWNLFDVEAGHDFNDIYGMAFDIGTTTVVGYLINLDSGELTAISSMLNPQVVIGEDLISRITYIVKHKSIESAKSLLISAINELMEDCAKKAKISLAQIKDIAIVGNTGIHHMFFGIPTEYLSISPYVPVFKAPINVSAGLMGINCSPNINIYSPPVIAGYVGTDTIGCIVSSKIYEYDKYSLLIDIGTNGELVLGNKNGLVTGSCAAGSALEGAHISCGMRGCEGAIESVNIDRNSLEPSIGVIGNVNPLGLCGSGLIDIVAEMLKSKIITRAGKFNLKSDQVANHRRIVKREDGPHYIVYKSEWDIGALDLDPKESDVKEITISQKDLGQLQLAKGAFLSSANLLLGSENKSKLDLEQVLLAGGFGNYIKKENAAFIGLFPEIAPEQIYQVGNSAGMGAQLFIKDYEERNLADRIAHEVKYHEIASSPLFQKEYAFSLYFPHYNLDNFENLKDQYRDVPI
ncbi:MAG: DUF4445 domain-containing protein [Candidatus Lokiarchaeota archaeon]|nr:DUF4445 domain-containing protein [Candidatus Lokiarchaeota archaeon]